MTKKSRTRTKMHHRCEDACRWLICCVVSKKNASIDEEEAVALCRSNQKLQTVTLQEESPKLPAGSAADHGRSAPRSRGKSKQKLPRLHAETTKIEAKSMRRTGATRKLVLGDAPAKAAEAAEPADLAGPTAQSTAAPPAAEPADLADPTAQSTAAPPAAEPADLADPTAQSTAAPPAPAPASASAPGEAPATEAEDKDGYTPSKAEMRSRAKRLNMNKICYLYDLPRHELERHIMGCTTYAEAVRELEQLEVPHVPVPVHEPELEDYCCVSWVEKTWQPKHLHNITHSLKIEYDEAVKVACGYRTTSDDFFCEKTYSMSEFLTAMKSWVSLELMDVRVQSNTVILEFGVDLHRCSFPFSTDMIEKVVHALKAKGTRFVVLHLMVGRGTHTVKQSQTLHMRIPVWLRQKKYGNFKEFKESGYITLIMKN